MILGPIFRAVSEVKDYIKLPSKIEDLESNVNAPLIDYFPKTEKYYALAGISLFKLYKGLENEDKRHQQNVIVVYINEMEEHLMTQQSMLETQSATKYDIEKLAISISEIALLLDKNLREFEESSNKMIESLKMANREQINQFKKESANILIETKKSVNNFTIESKSVLSSLTKEFQSQLSSQGENADKMIKSMKMANENQLEQFKKESTNALVETRKSVNNFTIESKNVLSSLTKEFQNQLSIQNKEFASLDKSLDKRVEILSKKLFQSKINILSILLAVIGLTMIGVLISLYFGK